MKKFKALSKVLALTLVFVFALSALSGCGQKDAGTPNDTQKENDAPEGTLKPEDISMTVVQKNLVNPVWVSLQQGAEDAAAELGITVKVMAPAQDMNNEEQIGIMEQAIARGDDAIVLVPADSTGIVPGVEKANEAGIPVINVNSKVDTSTGCKVETFINVENYDAAMKVAEKLAEMLDYKGNVVILEGKAGTQVSADIVRGANDVFAKYPDITVVASQSAVWSRSEGMVVTQNLLQAHSNIDAIFAANDEMAMGAVEAVAQAGLQESILITGLDANPDAKEAVDNGKLAITCDKNGYQQGYQGVMAAYKFLMGETLPEFIEIPTELYVKE